MKKKRYKKIIKKLNKLMILVESNIKTTIINDWPQPLQQEWEIRYTDPSLFETISKQ